MMKTENRTVRNGTATTYTIVYSDHAEMAGASSGAYVVMPGDDYDGVPITVIGEDAFSGHTEMIGLRISSTVTRIAANAFKGCTMMDRFDISEIITNIDGTAFDDTPWLEAKRAESPLVVVNNNLIDARIYDSGFNIPEVVTAIGGSAFRGRDDLTEIVIPDGITSIGSNAFAGCTNLTAVTIPEEDDLVTILDVIVILRKLTDMKYRLMSCQAVLHLLHTKSPTKCDQHVRNCVLTIVLY